MVDKKKDALGNTIQQSNEEPKELNRSDKKRLLKLRKEMMKRGEDTYKLTYNWVLNKSNLENFKNVNITYCILFRYTR